MLEPLSTNPRSAEESQLRGCHLNMKYVCFEFLAIK
jgi:hypothetical protein